MLRPSAPLLFTSACLLVASSVTPTVAEACSCGNVVQILPELDTEVVPTNTRVWIHGYLGLFEDASWDEVCEAAPVLIFDGGEVELVPSFVRGELLVLTPSAPLTEGTAYTLQLNCSDITAWIGEVEDSFTVNAAADQTAPTIGTPTVTAVHHAESPSDCGDTHYAEIELEHEGDLLLFDVDGEAEFDPQAFTGLVSDVERAGRPIQVGRGSCFRNWDEADVGASATVRYGALDLAGNFSGWTEHRVELGGDEAETGETGDEPGATQGSGCRVGDPGPVGAGLGLFGLLVFVGARRRPRAC